MSQPFHAQAELRPAPHGSGSGQTDEQVGTSRTAQQADNELVARLRARDESAARELYRSLNPSVERALRRIFKGDDSDIDDLIQVTFERLMDTLLGGSYRGACSLRTWAVSIATNVALETLRARYRERKFLRWASVIKNNTISAGPMQARLEVEELQSTLSAMKPKLVHTLLLHDVFGHDLREIASMERASMAAVQSRLVRSRRELMRRVGNKRGQA